MTKISKVLTGEETSENLDGLLDDLNCNDLVFLSMHL